MWPAHAAGSSASPSGRPVLSAVLCILFALLFAACEPTDNGIVPSGDGPAPAPAFVTLSDGIALSLQADRLNRGVSGRLAFTSSAYRLSIHVADRRHGSLTFELRDQDGLVQRLDEITSDTTLADSGRTYGRPTFVTVVFSGFSGRVDFALRDGKNLQEIIASEFPRAPGVTWRYRRVATGGIDEIVTVEALADTVLPEELFHRRIAYGRWLIRAAGGAWEEPVYLHLGETGVVFLQDIHDFPLLSRRFPPAENMLNLPFPLRGGCRWGSGYFGIIFPVYWRSPLTPTTDWFNDEAGMTFIGHMTVYGAEYQNAYRVDQWRKSGDGFTQPHRVQSFWIVPDVGFVRMETYAGHVTSETWELIP